MSSASTTTTSDATAVVLPPLPKKVPHTVKFGFVEGEVRTTEDVEGALIDPPLERGDDLFWLRDDDRKREDVIDHLKAENAYAAAQLADQKDLAAVIYKEHIGHILETDDSCPYHFGPFTYYTKTYEGKSYVAYARKPVSASSESDKEEILLDVNELAEGRSQCDVHSFEADPKHHAVVAYSLDLTGDECYDILFKKVSSKAAGDASDADLKIDGKKIPGTDGDVTWLPDGRSVLYTTRDDAKRCDKVWLHKLADADSKSDTLLFHEPDPLYSVGAGVTLNDEFVMIHSGSIETSEEWFLRLPQGTASDAAGLITKDAFTLLRKREFGVRYSSSPLPSSASSETTQTQTTEFAVLTNIDDCKTMKLVKVALASLADWSRVMVPHDPAVTYDDVLVLKRGIVLGGRKDGLSQVFVFEKDGAAPALLPQPEPIYDVQLVTQHVRNFDSATFRINYSSMVQPQQWIDIDIDLADAVKNTRRVIVKQKQVPNFDPSLYVCERDWAKAPDGTMVPMSILRKKATPMTDASVLLYGYGSYGITIDARFSQAVFPLVDRDFVYVIAHVRGGGEMGRLWYEQHGKMHTKRNTFTDFIACAEHLIKKKVTTPAKLAIEGRSAGGLLVGAVVNMRPDLFRVAVAGVPFVDVMVTMCDATIPLTTGEFCEWGNPNTYRDYEVMRSYSPMDNIVRGVRYPHMLVLAGLHDPRVAYWEPAKWVCRIREAQQKGEKEKESRFDTVQVFKCDVEAGHFSANDRYKYWREKSVEQAFVIKHIVGLSK